LDGQCQSTCYVDREHLVRMRLVVLVCLTLVAMCCSSRFGKAELIGEYQATFDYGVETLILKGDGSYEQTFKYNSGAGLTNSGMWEYPVECLGETGIKLADALKVDDQLGWPERKVEKYDWYIVPRKFFGKTSIEVNSDLGIDFEKKD